MTPARDLDDLTILTHPRSHLLLLSTTLPCLITVLGEVADRNRGYEGAHGRRKIRRRLLPRRRPAETPDGEEPVRARPLCVWLVQPGLTVTVEADLSINLWAARPSVPIIDMTVLTAILHQVHEFRYKTELAVVGTVLR